MATTETATLAERWANDLADRFDPPENEFKDRYWDHPGLFGRECIKWGDGEGLTDYQFECLEMIPVKKRVSIRGPHGLGKTMLAAIAILWFALTRDGLDWKIPTTASAWRQLTKYLWPEVRKWARRLDWEQIGRRPFRAQELLTISLRLPAADPKGEAFAVTSTDSDLIEGAHADHGLYVFDESKSIPVDTWDAAEGAFSSGIWFALSISTPGEPQGRFYDIQRRAKGYEDWWVRHVRLEEAIAAGRIGQDWADKRKRQWGEKSAVYQNRCLGEFAASDEDSVIPLSHIEAANLRWLEWDDAGRPLVDKKAMTAVGVDVARYGADTTVFALRYDKILSELRKFAKMSTMETCGRVIGILNACGGRAVVDVIGVGAGVVDRLRELKANVLAFSAGQKTNRKDRSGERGFADKRSAAWWGMRERLDPELGDDIMLPPDDQLTADLTTPHYDDMSNGDIKVWSKRKIRELLGRSTNDGDAVIQAFWEDSGFWVWSA